jgi:gluconokinase
MDRKNRIIGPTAQAETKEGSVRGRLAVVLMGVTGCGKTTIGELLSRELGWVFLDGDDFHPEANVRKMAEGLPLTDDDRYPWLERLATVMGDRIDAGTGCILACSALKESYRKILAGGREEIRFAHLKGTQELIGRRLSGRKHRYMPASLLRSQFEALEESPDSLVVDITGAPQDAVWQIRRGFEI